MAISSEAKAEISVPRKWQDMKEQKVWMEARPMKKAEQKVPVIYYLSRNGQLEQPHFMVVPLSSPQGLHLKDVISRLSCLRGQGIANMYSWSSKRSYKNNFVWQDLSEDDFIYPCQGHEYVLKGSQLLESNSMSFRSFESTSSSFSSSSSSMFSRETNSPGDEYLNTAPPTTITRRKNQSCGSFDELREYQVYRPKTAAKAASTQTEDKARQRRSSIAEVAEPAEGNGDFGGLESLKGSMEDDRTVENARECGKTKASAVLMQLIRCGSRIKVCEPTKIKDQRGDI